MMDTINYPELMTAAFRSVISEILKDVEVNGLPAKSHFMISFLTHHPGVEVPDWLRDEHPHEIQIILQHWFKDLKTGAAGFWVTLNFDGKPESIYVPYHALTTFADPGAGVEFSLAPLMSQSVTKNQGDAAEQKGTPAEIVSLDNFRKS